MDESSRPKPTYTAVDVAPAPDSTSGIAAIRTEDHVVWDEPDRFALGRLEPTFVLVSWLVALATTVVIFALSTGIVAMISDRPLTGETNTELGVLTILSAMSTFIGFVVVMTIRLVRVEHDRVVNSLAVAALHVGIAVLLFLGALAGQAAFDNTGASSIFDGSVTEQLGNVFTVLERSSVAAILACLLAIGMVPARGDRPEGTQTDITPQDRQL